MDCDECGGSGEAPDPQVNPRVKSVKGKLERGWRKQWLLGKLARSEGTHEALGEALGVTKSAVGMFALRHKAEIEQMRADLSTQINELWIADKLSRLAEMQTDVEDINEIIAGKLDAATPTPNNPLDPAEGERARESVVDDLPAWLRTKLAILRGAAEELGQIPNRVQMQVGGSIVTYKIEGVDLEQI